MTELEKAHSNRHHEIDYNKLLDELHDSYEDYAKRMAESCRTGVNLGRQEFLAPALNTLFALNSFVNRAGADFRELPLIVAGIGVLLDSLSKYMEDDDKFAADTIRECLAHSIRAVNVSFMKPTKED